MYYPLGCIEHKQTDASPFHFPLHIVLIHRSVSALKTSLCGLTTEPHPSVWTLSVFGFGCKTEPQLCHGNLWTWSWTRPKTIDQIQTNTILALCFVPSSFRFILLPMFSLLLFPPHLIVSRWAFWPQAHYENKVLYPPHLLFSFFLFNSPAPLW